MCTLYKIDFAIIKICFNGRKQKVPLKIWSRFAGSCLSDIGEIFVQNLCCVFLTCWWISPFSFHLYISVTLCARLRKMFHVNMSISFCKISSQLWHYFQIPVCKCEWKETVISPLNPVTVHRSREMLRMKMFDSLCTKQTMLTLQCFMCLLTLNIALMDGIQSCLSEKHRIVELLIEIPHACSCLSRCVVTIKRSVFEENWDSKSWQQ